MNFFSKEEYNMAKPIQPLPTHKGDDAKRFLENLEKESTPENRVF